MAFTTTAVLSTMALLATAAGSAMAYSSQQSAAKSNEAMALANAQAQTRAARNSGQLQAAQAQLEAIKAGKEGESAAANAAAMRAQVEAESRNSQENIRREGQDWTKVMAQQRAAIAARGVVDTTGSPLELLVKGAGEQQLAMEEMRYADEIKRRQGFREADLEAVRGKVAGLDVGMSLLRQAAAQNNIAMGTSQARLDLLGARAQSAGMRNQATAGLISSAGSLAGSYYSYRQTSTPKTY